MRSFHKISAITWTDSTQSANGNQSELAFDLSKLPDHFDHGGPLHHAGAAAPADASNDDAISECLRGREYWEHACGAF